MCGSKRAVLCDVSYHNPPHSLIGSVSDIQSMKCLLADRMGFPDQSVLVLAVHVNPSISITTITYRGHATPLDGPDCKQHLNSIELAHPRLEEFDDYDEALCPVDYNTAGRIVDDEIYATIVGPLPHGAKLHAIMDTCYSRTFLDLYFMCRMDSKGKYQWEDHHTIWHI
ncbi:hypothetical protein LguiA_027189 [Lonicera macranthoides]